jgi:hypothetical protein
MNYFARRWRGSTNTGDVLALLNRNFAAHRPAEFAAASPNAVNCLLRLYPMG